MKTMAIFLSILFTIEGSLSDTQLDKEWKKFKRNFGRPAFDPLEPLRKTIFSKNLQIIQNHNKRYRKGIETYTMGVNQLSDRTDAELDGYTGLNLTLTVMDSLVTIRNDSLCKSSVPTSSDWRKRGVITPVKDQTSHCHACWAFAAVGALEAHYKLRCRATAILSEQQLIDCVAGTSCKSGGNPANAYSYLVKHGGSICQRHYPYKARKSRCRHIKARLRVTLRGYAIATRNDEQLLKQKVATHGPVVVYIHVDKTFDNYKRGIYFNSRCDGALNHAVVVVGYGRKKKQDYWIVKNSWGVKWGERGYARMARNKNNHCGIASIGIYPLL